MKYTLIALVLFALAACVPVNTLELPSTTTLPNAAEAGTLATGEVQTYFERTGRTGGQPVLLIHGIGGGSSLFQYRKNSTALTNAGYEVYALDLIGFGRSSRPAGRVTQDDHVRQIETFITELIAEPAVIVANGLSAAYSIRLAAERPDLVEALVLIGPTGFERLARPQTEERVLSFERFEGVLGETLYQVLLADNIRDIFLLDAYAGQESLTPEVINEFDTQLRVENAKWIVLSFITGNLDQDVSGLWSSVEQPSLIVWGADAETTPLEDSEDFLAARADTGLVVVDNAKLVPNEDQPELFNAAVLEFLSGLE